MPLVKKKKSTRSYRGKSDSQLLVELERQLDDVQDTLGGLINIEARQEEPERTAFMSDLWDVIEKKRKVLGRPPWWSARKWKG